VTHTPSVFVTGGSGFIGGHLLEDLARDHRVRALARSADSALRVRAYGAEPVRGALGAVSPADLAGTDVVIHAAAHVEAWGTREAFWATNVDGTRQLLGAARAAGVRRFVFVSTEAVLFDGRDLVDVDEAHPYPARHRYLYSASKAEAERLVLAASTPEFEALAVRPRLVWGPRDTTVLPALRALVDAGRWSWLDHGRARTSTTHVHNLVRALRLATTRGRGGEAYFVADPGERSLRQFLTALLATVGVPLPDRSTPGWVARPMARLVEGAWRALGRTSAPPLTAFEVAMMSRTVTVNTSKARTELGYVPIIGVADGIGALTAPERIPEVVIRATAPHVRPGGRRERAVVEKALALDARQDDAQASAEGGAVPVAVDERAGEP